MKVIPTMHLKINYLKSKSQTPGDNELKDKVEDGVTLKSQHTLYTSLSQVSYGVSIGDYCVIF